MKILITGGLGYVGGRLIAKLCKKHTIICSTRNKPDVNIFSGKVSYISHHELLNPDTFPNEIDAVIHLAALNEIESVRQVDLAIEVNIGNSRTVFENAIIKGVKKVIFFSTIHVYGKRMLQDDVISEYTLPAPTHPYAITHHAAEEFLLAEHEKGRVEAIVVRLSNSFGSPIRPQVNRWTLLVNDICKQAVESGVIKLLSNGCQYRDFITLSDVEQAVEILLEGNVRLDENIFNLSSGKSITVLEMAKQVAHIASQQLGVSVPVYPKEGSIITKEHYFIISCDRLKRHGFFPTHDFTLELSRMIEFCRSHFVKL